MLDQFFSGKNFYNILVYRNRKGENLEGRFFEEEIFDTYTVKLKELNAAIRKRRKTFRAGEIDEELYSRYRRSCTRENRASDLPVMPGWEFRISKYGIICLVVWAVFSFYLRSLPLST